MYSDVSGWTKCNLPRFLDSVLNPRILIREQSVIERCDILTLKHLWASVHAFVSPLEDIQMLSLG